MNRRLAVFAIAAVAALGLTACSGGSASPETEGDGDTTATAPAEQPAADQSVEDACAEVQVKIQDASTAVSEIDVSTAADDPQATVDAFTETVEGVGEAADSVSNEEVKAAVTAVYEDFVALRDGLEQVLVEQNMDAASDLTTVATDVQTSAQELSTLCTG
jgi:uncharacterized protein with HEPN domain